MPSFHWDSRALIVIIFGTVTVVLWILCIWQLVLRFKSEPSPPSPSPCENSGAYENGLCLCPGEWTGPRCETVNFCGNSTYLFNSSQNSSEIFTFKRIVVDSYGYSEEKCEDAGNAATPKASRKCSKISGKPTLADVKIMNCSRNLTTLMDELRNTDTSKVNISAIASDTQILTSMPETLTTEKISTAADIVEQILKNQSGATDAAVAAVVTVSQLLDARESEFNFTNNNFTDITASLTQTLEEFSLGGSSVQPNIAVQNLSLEVGSTTAFLSVKKGSKNLQSENIKVGNSVSDFKNDANTEVQILINITNNNTVGSSTPGSIGFVLYQNDKFFQSKTYRSHYNYTKRIISGRVANATVNDVQIAFNPWYNPSILLHNYACVFWDYSENDWNTKGCKKEGDILQGLRCRCNHTTSFAVLMSFRINYTYAKPLEIVSDIGIGFSIGGLVITILFQTLTWKTRKFSVTWMLVNLCTAMLIFNIIFISGIENPNVVKKNNGTPPENTLLHVELEDPPENALCTAVAVLLHYFLLATFMWTALNSAQLYLLLLKTLKPLPGHFTLIMSIIGWGFPAVVVAITFGATYRDGKHLNYRREEFCWLAALDENGNVSKEKPMIWAFLLIVAIILLFNIIVFVKITVLVMWKENTNLTSNKKKSFRTKILGTLSVAVVLGITWVLGYLVLINNKEANYVFSILFCIFNATQGLQICILYTFRSPIFKKKVTEMLSFVSPPEIPIYLHSKTYYLLKFRHKKYKNETFKPSETFSEETSFSNN
ncbi:adhesion G-protein coupled receptor G7 [Pelodiscus sinensis]|uniref:adhesion G-protein coupled receptor G7 n=1 Tax=Pelodiscus sinensis TaxID=13735 RepID=UPI003F6C0B1F